MWPMKYNASQNQCLNCILRTQKTHSTSTTYLSLVIQQVTRKTVENVWLYEAQCNLAAHSHKHSSDVNIILSFFLSSSSLAVISLACELVTQLATINCRIWPWHLSVMFSNYTQTHTYIGAQRTHSRTCWIPISRSIVTECDSVGQFCGLLSNITSILLYSKAQEQPPNTSQS